MMFKKSSSSSFETEKNTKTAKTVVDSPSSTAKDLYGYEDGAPDVAANKDSNKDNIYGYGTDEYNEKVHEYDGTRVPRRSSMKGSNPKRSASIGTGTAIDVEVRIPGKGTQRVHRRRSIDFCQGVRVKPIPKIPFELESKVWLQPEEFDRIKSERRELKHKMQSGEIMPWEEEELRGLEKYVDNGNSKARVHMGWYAVMDEQELQDMTDEYDDNRIAYAYQSSGTYMGQKDATTIGKLDALEVRDYLQSPKTNKLMMRAMRRCSC